MRRRPPNRREQEGLRAAPGSREQSENNFLPNTGQQRVPVRATDTKNPRVQAPALAYEPGGRRFESCRARQINNLQPPIFARRTVVNNLFARVLRMPIPWHARLGLGPFSERSAARTRLSTWFETKSSRRRFKLRAINCEIGEGRTGDCARDFRAAAQPTASPIRVRNPDG